MESASKVNNLSVSFVQLAQNRYSVREYSSEPVSQELLDKAYEVSMKTPSVCNRQATRVYQITDSEKIKAALSIQGGFHGYAMPPVLLLVTSDIRAFMNNGERNEPFVDGGLFSMSLLYALEAYGLAACPLNAMFSLSQDRQTRALLNMPDYELPVMYIAVGNFPNPCRYAVRRDEIPKQSSRNCSGAVGLLICQVVWFCVIRPPVFVCIIWFWWIKPEELSTRVLWSPVMRKLDMTSAPPYESELP